MALAAPSEAPAESTASPPFASHQKLNAALEAKAGIMAALPRNKAHLKSSN